MAMQVRPFRSRRICCQEAATGQNRTEVVFHAVVDVVLSDISVEFSGHFLGAGPSARTLFIWVQKLKWNSAVCGAARAQRQATNRVASLHLSVGLGNQQMENSDCLLVDDVDFAVKVSNTNEPAEWPAADGRGTHSCPAVRHFRDRLRCQRIHLPDNIYTSQLRS